MKTKVSLPKATDFQILVSKGDGISRGKILAKFGQKAIVHKIHLSKLLNVNNSKVSEYLDKKLGEQVILGEVIAKRSSLFSSCVIKSPVSGFLKEIDLKTGILNISEVHQTKDQNIISYVDGKVVQIDDEGIIIEFEGEEFGTVEFYADFDIFGPVIVEHKEIIKVSDVSDIFQESVILCKSANDDAWIKMEVLGVLAVVLIQKPKVKAELPYVLVKEEVFDMLKSKNSHNIWLKSDDNKLIVINNNE